MEIIANGNRRNSRKLHESYVQRKRVIRESYQIEKHSEGKVISWLKMQFRFILARFEVKGNDKNY